VALALVLLSTGGCLPPAAWTAGGYTTDETRSSEAAGVVGQCFRLRYDADVQFGSRRIDVKHVGAVDIAGRVYFVTPPRPPSAGQPRLPKGTRIGVERVLLWRNVETSFRTPYIRLDEGLVDAKDLFRDTGEGEGPRRLTYVDRLIAPCAANEQAH